jgi:hypothetical protein
MVKFRGARGERAPAPAVVVVVGLFLAGSVLAAVHHAEVVAHRVGEPFGSLVLAVAVTVIEVALIVTLMVSGGEETSTLARDTVFAAAMITCNGIVGILLLLGALGRGVATFNAEGPAPRSRRWPRWPRCASCCRRSRPAARARSSRRPSSPSRRSPRSSCTGPSCSCRRSGTATTSWVVHLVVLGAFVFLAVNP